MKPKLIKNDAEHAAALARIEQIFDAAPGTPEGDELELLTTLAEKYEQKAFPMDLPDPVEALRFRMDQQGLRNRDLVPYIGSASKVSEVLSRKRPLSLTMIRNLVDGLDIPAEVLLGRSGSKIEKADSVSTASTHSLTVSIRRLPSPARTKQTSS